MPSRTVSIDRPRRVAFSPKGTTVVVVNQDPNQDVFVAVREEMLLPAFGNAVTGGNLYKTVGAVSYGGIYGTRLAAGGGQLNYVDYPGEIWAISSGVALTAAGAIVPAPAGTPTSVDLQVLPG